MKKFKLILAMLIFSFVAFALGYSPSAQAYGTEVIYVQAQNEVYKTHHAYSKNGKIYIDFIGPVAMQGTAIIHYSTQDATAVASSGDYTAVSGTVTLTKEEHRKTVSISVGGSKFAVESNSYVTTRYFKFIITEVEYQYGTVDPDNREILCDINYANRYSYTEENGKRVLDEYKLYYLEDGESGTAKHGENYYLNDRYTGDKYRQLAEKYVDSGLADFYTGISIDYMDDSSRFGDPEFIMRLYNGKGNDIIGFSFDNHYFDNYSFGFSKQIDKYKNGGYNEVAMTVGTGRDVFYNNSIPFFGVRTTDCTNNENVKLTTYRVFGGIDNTDSLIIDKALSFSFSSTLHDRINPYVKEAFGIDNQIAYNSNKTRIAIRFNEPVYVTDENVYAKVKFGSTAYYFKYSEGSNTDTLVFEIDSNKLKSNYTFKSFTIAGLYNDAEGKELTNRILDFSDSSNVVEAIANEIKAIYEFDFSSPTIKGVSSSDSTSPKISRQIDVDVTNINNGKIYYLFSKSKELEITLNDDSSNLEEYLGQYQSYIPTQKDIFMYNIFSSDKKGNNLNGEYYLHIYAISGNSKGVYQLNGSRISGGEVLPYKFDSTSPEPIEYDGLNYKITNNSQNSKNIMVSVNDPETSYGLDFITLSGTTYAGNKLTKTVWKKGSDVVKKLEDYEFTISAADLELEDGGYGYISLTLTVYDICGNSTDIAIDDLFYDTRDTFDVSEAIKGTTVYTTKYKDNVVKLDSATELVYSIEDALDLLAGTNKYAIQYLEYAGVKYYNNCVMVKDPADVLTITKDDRSITIKPLVDGYLKVIFSLNYVNGSDAVEESNVFSSYFSKSFNDELVNSTEIQNAKYIKNYLYTLNDGNYYYMDTNNEIQSVPYTGNNKLSPVFSDRSKAFEYVKYMEYQDMKVIYLDNSEYSKNIITFLNSGTSSTGYSKSQFETQKADTNQYWVRYKESTWTPGSTNWVYYYLSNVSGELNPVAFSKVLTNAINDVSNRIVKNGNFVYFAGDDKLDNNGYPNVDDCQILLDRLEASVTKSLSSFKNPISIEADTDIYDSEYREYVYNGNIIHYVNTDPIKYLMHYYPNLEDSRTKLLYAVYDSNKGIYYQSYKELNIAKNTELDSYLPSASNVYLIMELGVNGICVTKVFLDKQSPTLNVKYETGASSDINLMQEHDGDVLSVKSINFGYILNEADIYSYIHIYKTTDPTKCQTYSLTDLLKSEVILEDGDYYLVVSDRYGNSYKLTLRINGDALDVSAAANGNQYYVVEINNRTEEQIVNYEVYLDGNLIESKFQQRLRIKDSGVYTVKVTDIYGYTFTKEESFTRILPSLTWRYFNGSKYELYKEGDLDAPMSITKITDYYYIINTSVKLQCTFSRDYTGEVDYTNEYVAATDSQLNKRININALSNWELRVFYPEDPSSTVRFVCVFDSEAPKISALYDVTSYNQNDYDDLVNLARLETEEGIRIEGKSYEFSPSGSSIAYITDGSTIDSASISVNITDSNFVKEYYVYLDGKLIDSVKVTNSDEFKKQYSITLDKYGVYQIVATDMFGNTSTFTFTNNNTLGIERTIDGVVSEEARTGNSYDQIAFKQNGLVYYQIKVNGTTKIYPFMIDDYGVHELAYETVLVDGSMSWQAVFMNEIYLANNALYSLNRYYDTSCEYIKVMVTKDGYVFTVSSAATKTEINYSYYPKGYSKVYVYSSTLSKEITNLPFYYVTDKSELETVEDGSVILAHDSFEINYDDYDLSNIVSVKMVYSATSKYNPEDLVEIALDPNYSLETSEDGYYIFVITNVYGNEVTYVISKFIDINVEVEVTYINLEQDAYSTNYTGTIYSNKSIKVLLYDTNMYRTFKVEVLVNDNYVEDSTIEINSANNAFYALLTEIGSYRVTIVDYYGNNRIRNLEIKKANLEYDENLITGWNTNALLEDYTNNVLSINKEAVDSNNIEIIKINDTYIYNTVSEAKYINDETLLINCIGDGESTKIYTVVFEDKYGNELVKNIHYSAHTTLSLSRNYKTNISFEGIDISSDVYTNNSIKLTTTANNYKCTADGRNVSLELVFSFLEDGNYFSKNIVYQDEYGFKHEFTVHIVREDIEISVISDAIEKEIDKVLTIGDNFKLSYNENTTCTYTINDSGSYTYHGELITSDGIYYFTVVDFAGNEASLRIKHDTKCEFSFVDNTTAKNIIDGGVVNTARTVFKKVNNDSVSIVSVTRNGVDYEIVNNSFTEAGYYEVLIKDEIGNSTKFTFYIITHKLSSFEYNSPNGYIIKEMYVETNKVYKDVYTGFDSTHFLIDTDGVYTCILENILTKVNVSFKFEITSECPIIVLDGVDENSSTKSDVVIKNLNSGDIVKIYKNGKLVDTVEISSQDQITITDAGNYRVEVENEAGLKSEVQFKKQFVMNTAGTVLVIILLLLGSTILFFGIFIKRSKVDK